MVFSSLIFIFIFLPVCTGLYFLMPNLRVKNFVLMLLSLLFYAWGEPVWVVLLLFSSLQDYICGLVIEKYRGQWQAKAALLFSLIINFSLLGFFKYIDFFLGNLNLLFGAVSLNFTIPLVGVSLPIGISFYTFQTVSYTIDMYWGKVKVQKNFFNFILFVSLFSQLIAGPILRYSDIADQIGERAHTWDKAARGITRFIIGLAKKVLLANAAAQIATAVLANPQTAFSQLPVADAWLGILGFTFQIYFDFSGYSDMAIGLGWMFGFTYPENFVYPYISRSITEFWRRWHISLSSFFRDYIYFPMGGSRVKWWRHIINLFVVWLLTGLWHGAAWNFVVWGLYFFVILCFEKFILFKITKKIRAPKWLGAAAGWFYAFFLIVIGWVFFYTPDPVAFKDVDVSGPTFYLLRSLKHLGAMFGLGGNPLTGAATGTLFFNNLIMMVIFFAASTPVAAYFCNKWRERRVNTNGTASIFGAARLALAGVILILCVAQLVGSSYNPFIYFRF